MREEHSDSKVQTGTVVKPIRNWCRVVHDVGKKVVVRHWREDFRTCTVENKDGTECQVGVPLSYIKLHKHRGKQTMPSG